MHVQLMFVYAQLTVYVKIRTGGKYIVFEYLVALIFNCLSIQVLNWITNKETNSQVTINHVLTCTALNTIAYTYCFQNKMSYWIVSLSNNN